MKNHKKCRSTIEPQALKITAKKVYVNVNVTQITDAAAGFSGYEFDCDEYEKDEYIKVITAKNESLQEEMTETQLALCEVYELLAV